ncbi:hypothetical protein D3C85_1748680 [compost metagenome]
MPWARLGCRPSPAAASLKSCMDCWAQASKLDMSWSRRTGMEPLFWLKNCWNCGSRMVRARSFCALMFASSLSLNMARESML